MAASATVRAGHRGRRQQAPAPPDSRVARRGPGRFTEVDSPGPQRSAPEARLGRRERCRPPHPADSRQGRWKQVGRAPRPTAGA